MLRNLGSRLANGATTGRNFLTREVAQLAWREAVYREPGALIDEPRFWNNLLSSQPLTFNLFGPLRLDLYVATTVLRELCPDLSDAEVTGVLFEHSPGRGDPSLTGDGTAFDAALVYHRADARTGLVAIEVKYSEDCTERQKPLGSACEVALILPNLFVDPGEEALRTAPLQQLTREHVLAQAAVTRGDYDEGRFIVVAPRLNQPVQDACRRYQAKLDEPAAGHVTFASWTMEQLVDALATAGDPAYAAALFDRYLAFDRIDEIIASYTPFSD